MDKEKLQQGLNEYEAKVAKATAKFPERKNFEAQRLYTPLDIEDFDYGEKLGFPGQYPFTRGVQLQCTADACGPCAPTPVLPRPKKPTRVINICWRPGRPGFRLLWTCRRRLALTVTTNSAMAK